MNARAIALLLAGLCAGTCGLLPRLAFSRAIPRNRRRRLTQAPWARL